MKWEACGRTHGCWQMTIWKVSQIVNYFLAHYVWVHITRSKKNHKFLKPKYKNCRILTLLVINTSSQRLFICLKKIWCSKDQQKFCVGIM
jgi:hypothetical protein